MLFQRYVLSLISSNNSSLSNTSQTLYSLVPAVLLKAPGVSLTNNSSHLDNPVRCLVIPLKSRLGISPALYALSTILGISGSLYVYLASVLEYRVSANRSDEAYTRLFVFTAPHILQSNNVVPLVLVFFVLYPIL